MTFSADTDTRDMLPLRCPNCDCAEDGGAPLRFQLRLQRTVRLISVCLVLLLGMALTTLVLLLFGSPALLRQREQPDTLNVPTAPDAVSEKQQSGNDLKRPSALLTIKQASQPEWQYGVGNTHISEGMTCESGHLRVLSKGLYRLYVQITFEFLTENYKRINISEICDNDHLSLIITVERRSQSYRNFSELLVSEDTMSCSHDWTKSMYTSGTYELEAQSELKVDILHMQLVKIHDTLSFLGAELISAL